MNSFYLNPAAAFREQARSYTRFTGLGRSRSKLARELLTLKVILGEMQIGIKSARSEG